EDDGVETRTRFELEVGLNGRTTHVKIPASAFSSMTWATEQCGAEAVVFAGLALRDHTRVAVQVLSGNVRRRRVFSHTGWRQLESGWAYLHGGGAIGAVGTVPQGGGDSPRENPPYIEVVLPEPLSRYELPAPPSGSALVEALRASIRMLDVAP